jgi:hypothetical protein
MPAPTPATLNSADVQTLERRCDRVLSHVVQRDHRTNVPHAYLFAMKHIDWCSLAIRFDEPQDAWREYVHARTYLKDAVREFRAVVPRTA